MNGGIFEGEHDQINIYFARNLWQILNNARAELRPKIPKDVKILKDVKTYRRKNKTKLFSLGQGQDFTFR